MKNMIIKRIFVVTTISLMMTLIHQKANAQDYKSLEEAEGIKVDMDAPRFSAIDKNSKLFSLDEAIKSGPVVLIFYRGFWCPVCNKHLGKIQDSLKLIEERGARVIAVSPEKPEYLGEMAEKTGAEFTLLYDEDYKIADAYDVNFKPSASSLLTYNTFLGAKLKETHSDESQRLPIPATYLIDRDGVIVWRQFDPDYKKRSSVKAILEALQEVQ